MTFYADRNRVKPHLLSSVHAAFCLGRSPSKSPSNAGFSLLEVLAVAAILGILSAIAAPGWLAFTTNQRLRSAQDEVLQAIRTTQSTAKQTRRSAALTFQNTAGSVPAISFANRPFQELGNGELEPNMIALTVTDGDNTALTQITFDQDGTLDQNADIALPVQITLSSPTGGAKRCIFVASLLGSTRLASKADCP